MVVLTVNDVVQNTRCQGARGRMGQMRVWDVEVGHVDGLCGQVDGAFCGTGVKQRNKIKYEINIPSRREKELLRPASAGVSGGNLAGGLAGSVT